ncbi:acyltransferase family protein [Hyphobacterium marinum]|uniref:Acyltransferase n=1 Tax=Hyphobacterium marinum TaxID=3116574 RepID=A0ABU7M2K1_9PROT|nr:acyltransferase [Hyphobacterium sp. Y6023]MEE2567495.1 acyltransferase [Hyphobacterium sp. Y6023]
MGPSQRIDNIQALRALAALLVVVIHIQANELRAAGDPLLSGWLYHGVAGVDLFFVISGFIMVYVTRGRFAETRNALRFWFDRAVRVYPPVWLFTALAIAGFYAQGTQDFWFSQSGVVESFLLIPQHNPPLLGVSWTLLHELYFYLVFGLFLLPRERFLPVGLGLWALIVAAGLALGIDSTSNPWLAVAFHPHTYEFLLGAAAALVLYRGWYRFPWLITALGLAAFLTGAVVLGLRGPDDYPAWWGRVLAFGPASALLVLGMAALERDQGVRAPVWTRRIGDWSYSLYLSHLLIIAALAHIWTRFARPGIADNLVFITLMVIVPVVFAALAYTLFERPTLRAGKRLGDQILPPRPPADRS